MHLLRHPLALVTITLLAGLFSFSLFLSTRRTQTSAEQVRVLDQEIQQMAREVSTLEERVNKGNSEAAQEKIIRDQLLMQKPGEYVVQLPGQIDNPAQTAQNQGRKSNWQQWLEVLF